MTRDDGSTLRILTGFDGFYGGFARGNAARGWNTHNHNALGTTGMSSFNSRDAVETAGTAMLGLMKARRMMMKRVSNRQRRKLLSLDDEHDVGHERREHPVEEIKRIAELPANRRSPFDIDVLRDALSNVSIFRKVSKEGLLNLTSGLRLRVLQPGEILCAQGEQGDVMWVIVQGSLEAWLDGAPAPLEHASAFVAPAAEDAPNASDRESLPAHAPATSRPKRLERAATMTGNDMHSALRAGEIGTMVNVATPTEPGYSGELALLQGASCRACTMRAGLPDELEGLPESALETVLLEITRQQFENTAIKLVQEQASEKMACLRKCAALKGLPEAQLVKLSYHMQRVILPAHTTLARKGEPITGLYLVAEGECKCLDVPPPAAAAVQAKGSSSSSSSGSNPVGLATAAVSRHPRARLEAHRSAMMERERQNAEGQAAAAAGEGGGGGAGGARSGSGLPLHVPAPLQPPAPGGGNQRRPRAHGAPRGVEIAKLGAGQLIGDLEIMADRIRFTAGAGGSAATDNSAGGRRVWQQSYVSAGPLKCFVVKPSDFEKRILDPSASFTRKLADEIRLKQQWRYAQVQQPQPQAQATMPSAKKPTPPPPSPKKRKKKKKMKEEEETAAEKGEGQDHAGATGATEAGASGAAGDTATTLKSSSSSSSSGLGMLADRYGCAITVHNNSLGDLSIDNQTAEITCMTSLLSVTEAEPEAEAEHDDSAVGGADDADAGGDAGDEAEGGAGAGALLVPTPPPELPLPLPVPPRYPSLSYASLPSSTAFAAASSSSTTFPAASSSSVVSELSATSQAVVAELSELSDWSWAMLQEEQRLAQMTRRKHLPQTQTQTKANGKAKGSSGGGSSSSAVPGLPGPSGSLGMGVGRGSWGGSRVVRRCPFFIEPPEALRYAKAKEEEEEESNQIAHINQLIKPPSSSSSSTSRYAMMKGPRAFGGRSGSRSSRLAVSSSSLSVSALGSSASASSYPRSYSARTARASVAPRFPPARPPALPTLAPIRHDV